MKVLVDEYVPFKLVRLLTGHAFTIAQQKGWDICDRNLEYQQNLKGRKIALLLLSTNHGLTLKGQVPLVPAALDGMRTGELLPVEIPRGS